MIRAVYCFHVYHHVRRVLKRLQVPLPHETGFNSADNPHTSSEFLKICEDYGVPNDPMTYRDKKILLEDNSISVTYQVFKYSRQSQLHIK